MLGRAWQGGHGKNVPSHLVIRLSGPCGVPCPLLLFTCLMPTISLFSSWQWIPRRGAPVPAASHATLCWRWVPPSQAFREWPRDSYYSRTRVTQEFETTEASPNGSGGAQMCLECQGCGCPPKAEPGFEGKVVEFGGTGCSHVSQLFHITRVGAQLVHGLG